MQVGETIADNVVYEYSSPPGYDRKLLRIDMRLKVCRVGDIASDVYHKGQTVQDVVITVTYKDCVLVKTKDDHEGIIYDPAIVQFANVGEVITRTVVEDFIAHEEIKCVCS